MQLSLSPQLKKKLARFSFHSFMLFWYRHHRFLFIVSFLVILLFSGWEWYYSLYRYRWSPEMKKAYLEKTVKETSFQEKEFQSLVKILDEQAARHAKEVAPSRDLFTGEFLVP